MEDFRRISFSSFNSDGSIDESAMASENGTFQCKFSEAAIAALDEKLSNLQDLFVRRLSEDKQKAEMIRTLEAGVNFTFIEPFLTDIILLLDRLDKMNDEFAQSVKEELLDIIGRRGVSKIAVTSKFDPILNKAIRVTEDDGVDTLSVARIIRNGYTFSGKVIRAAEVEVIKPSKKT